LHHLWPHQAYDIWPYQNPDDKHANQARELELADRISAARPKTTISAKLTAITILRRTTKRERPIL